MTLTSQFFCPSFAKLSKHYRERGLCRQIQVQKAGVARKGLEAPPAGPRVANPAPQTPIWIDDKEVTEDINIDETENSPRVPGSKRARDLKGEREMTYSQRNWLCKYSTKEEDKMIN